MRSGLLDSGHATESRLYPERDHIKFSYIDTLGIRRIIVYSLILKVWSVDDYKYFNIISPTERRFLTLSCPCCYAQEVGKCELKPRGSPRLCLSGTRGA